MSTSFVPKFFDSLNWFQWGDYLPSRRVTFPLKIVYHNGQDKRQADGDGKEDPVKRSRVRLIIQPRFHCH